MRHVLFRPSVSPSQLSCISCVTRSSVGRSGSALSRRRYSPLSLPRRLPPGTSCGTQRGSSVGRAHDAGGGRIDLPGHRRRCDLFDHLLSGSAYERRHQSAPSVIRMRGLVTRIGDRVLHDHIDLDVFQREVLGVVGGSGTGKSVLLRSIIGLQRPSARAALRCWGRTLPSSWRRTGTAANPLGRPVPGWRAVQ